jgi:predicted MPP superfamily phosphohydrolase
MKRKIVLLCFFFFTLFVTAQKITRSKEHLSFSHSGVSRVVRYDVYGSDIPIAFDGFRIAFISDLHYKSKFKQKGLASLVKMLCYLSPDLLLMGGDYQEGCEYVPELMDSLSMVHPPFGIVGVMGNNDYERCHDSIVSIMRSYGMKVLEHQLDTITKGLSRIIIAGVRNPFDLKRNGISPTLSLHDRDYVILLTHTPDYVEDVDNSHTDLALAGHTHGGQATLFGLYAPIVPSHYGQRFLRGLKYSSAGIPIIITNGIGTSRNNIRMFAPSEIVIIVLHPFVPR